MRLGRLKEVWRRSHFEIIAAILSLSSEEPMFKTHIMYRCNLSSEQLQKYFNYLLTAGFLEKVEESERDCYHATELGREFVREFQKLEGLLMPEQRSC